MIVGKTVSGFEYQIEEDMLDDYELLEVLCEADKGKASAMMEVAEKVLGVEQKERLKEHIRDDKGRVSARTMIEAVMEILKANGAGKN